MKLSWGGEEPPRIPPLECHNPALWEESYQAFRKHTVSGDSWCAVCNDVWPCQQHKFAVRGLLDSCMVVRRRQTDGFDVLEEGICVWCRQPIEFRGTLGWMHAIRGLFLCANPRDDAPPYCYAEPIE